MNEIRFNLDDIIEGELIEDVLVSLHMINIKSPISKVHFWHTGLDNNYIEKFFEYKKRLLNDIIVVLTLRNPSQDFVWFDVINNETYKRFDCSNRFYYVYPINKKSKMLLGIHNFYQMYNYIETHPKSRRILYDKNKENSQ